MRNACSEAGGKRNSLSRKVRKGIPGRETVCDWQGCKVGVKGKMWGVRRISREGSCSQNYFLESFSGCLVQNELKQKVYVTTGKRRHTFPWKISQNKTNCGLSTLSSVAQSCLTLCDPMNRSTLGLPVHHQLPEFTQTHVHRVGDAIQPSHPLSSPSPPSLNPSQHQGLFQWVNSWHEATLKAP